MDSRDFQDQFLDVDKAAFKNAPLFLGATALGSAAYASSSISNAAVNATKDILKSVKNDADKIVAIPLKKSIYKLKKTKTGTKKYHKNLSKVNRDFNKYKKVSNKIDKMFNNSMRRLDKTKAVAPALLSAGAAATVLVAGKKMLNGGNDPLYNRLTGR